MAAPVCNRYSDAVNRIKELVSSEKAACNLRRYLSSFDGAQFDRLTDRLAVDEFTQADFRAVRELRVNVLHTARQWLVGEGRDQVQQLLRDIPRILISGTFRPIGSTPTSGPAVQPGNCGRPSPTCKMAQGSPVSTSQRANCCTPNAPGLFPYMTGMVSVKSLTSATGTFGRPCGAHYATLRSVSHCVSFRSMWATQRAFRCCVCWISCSGCL
jgi:hypothetical protein